MRAHGSAGGVPDVCVSVTRVLSASHSSQLLRQLPKQLSRHVEHAVEPSPLSAHVAAHVPLMQRAGQVLLQRAGSTGGPSLGSGGGTTTIASGTMSPIPNIDKSIYDGSGTHDSVPSGQSSRLRHGHVGAELHVPHGRFCHTLAPTVIRAPRWMAICALSDDVPSTCEHVVAG